eukprot:TRINITY_DN808_c0_g1_i1.p1 TRINITY_DN808_c0_g1~~TRINITY_DN808_c0_g1_i1.p1  ORF type:complete len:863 (-),score=170.63 TRINITY_DN808_c0_g1_i1:203-2791(-)
MESIPDLLSKVSDDINPNIGFQSLLFITSASEEAQYRKDILNHLPKLLSFLNLQNDLLLSCSVELFDTLSGYDDMRDPLSESGLIEIIYNLTQKSDTSEDLQLLLISCIQKLLNSEIGKQRVISKHPQIIEHFHKICLTSNSPDLRVKGLQALVAFSSSYVGDNSVFAGAHILKISRNTAEVLFAAKLLLNLSIIQENIPAFSSEKSIDPIINSTKTSKDKPLTLILSKTLINLAYNDGPRKYLQKNGVDVAFQLFQSSDSDTKVQGAKLLVNLSISGEVRKNIHNSGRIGVITQCKTQDPNLQGQLKFLSRNLEFPYENEYSDKAFDFQKNQAALSEHVMKQEEERLIEQFMKNRKRHKTFLLQDHTLGADTAGSGSGGGGGGSSILTKTASLSNMSSSPTPKRTFTAGASPSMFQLPSVPQQSLLPTDVSPGRGSAVTFGSKSFANRPPLKPSVAPTSPLPPPAVSPPSDPAPAPAPTTPFGSSGKGPVAALTGSLTGSQSLRNRPTPKEKPSVHKAFEPTPSVAPATQGRPAAATVSGSLSTPPSLLTPPVDPTKEKENEKQRTNIAQELLYTENTYLQNIIRIDFKYKKDLERISQSRKPFITPAEVEILFGNISQIVRVNKMLFEALCQRLNFWNNKTTLVSDLFIGLGSFLNLYLEYISNYDHSLNLYYQLMQKKSGFYTYVKRQENEDPGAIELSSYLIQPVQRIPRYVLLLKELIKFTKPEHPDYANLHKALDHIRGIAEKINKEKSNTDNQIKLMAIQNSLVGEFEPIFSFERRFIKEGPVKRISGKNNKSKDSFFHLFNDLLIVSTPKPSKLGVSYVILAVFKLFLLNAKLDPTSKSFCCSLIMLLRFILTR